MLQNILELALKMIKPKGVKVMFKAFLTVSRFLPYLKAQINYNEKSNMVHEVPCQNGAFAYIGQTKRDLKSRIKEDQRAIKVQRPEK